MVQFSVVIPVYNKEPHVSRALQSVFDQTFPASEVLLIDDASTDDSIGVLEQMANNTVRVLRRDVPGPGGYHARNLGIREATSDWIAFLDADDLWEPHHLATLNAALEHAENSVGCVFARCADHFGPGELRFRDTSPGIVANQGEGINFDEFLRQWLGIGRSPINTSGVAIKRNLLLDVGGFPEGRCMRGGDKDLWLRACAATRTIAVPTVTSVYFRNAVNMATDKTDMNRIPCLCHSISDLMADADPERRKLLERLHNIEVFSYAFNTWRYEGLDRAQFRNYYIRRDPIRYLLLQAMILVPGSKLKRVRSWIRWFRAILTKPKHRAIVPAGTTDHDRK